MPEIFPLDSRSMLGWKRKWAGSIILLSVVLDTIINLGGEWHFNFFNCEINVSKRFKCKFETFKLELRGSDVIYNKPQTNQYFATFFALHKIKIALWKNINFERPVLFEGLFTIRTYVAFGRWWNISKLLLTAISSNLSPVASNRYKWPSLPPALR